MLILAIHYTVSAYAKIDQFFELMVLDNLGWLKVLFVADGVPFNLRFI